MNTKKHKNKLKQHKPNPQPKSDKTETEIAETQEKESVIKEEKNEPQDIVEIPKSDEPGPIVSEIVTPIVEAKVSEGDTPKKPKRNRGKKKKNEKDEESDDNIVEKIPELPVEEIKLPVETQKVTSVVAEEKLTETSEMTPAARKKKNKNKKHPEEIEKAEKIKIVPFTQEELDDVKIITCVPVAMETDESKSKKKNKKKKRTDSERSDKAEEVVSCTSAFQQLLQSDDKKEELKDTQSEQIKTDVKEEIIQEIIKEPANIEKELETAKPEADTKDSQKDEGAKGKKKNKKDKKHPPKTEDIVIEATESITEPSKTEVRLETPISETITEAAKAELPLVAIPISELNIKIIEKSIDNKPAETEKSPKAKPKIAKPVDKKRKGKADGASTENLSEIDVEKTNEKPINLADILKTSPSVQEKEEIKIDTPVVVSDTKIIDPIKEIKEEMKAPQEHEAKQKLAAEQGSGKKGKRGKQKLSSSEIKDAIVETEPIPVVKTDDDTKTKKETFDIRPITPITHVDEKVETKTKVIEKPPTELQRDTSNIPIPLGFTLTTLTPTETKVSATSEISNVLENIIHTETGTTKAELQLPESTLSKKRKKSPKRPKATEKTTEHVSEKLSTAFPEDIANKPEKKLKNVQTEAATVSPKDIISEELKESITVLPSLEEIEIKSIKTEESEGSVCDIVPDVHYPRASSQLLDDNNNTTVIQDVTASERKLNIPIEIPDTPLIQGSGETPLSCPELIPCGITFTEIEPNKCTMQDTATKLEDGSSRDIVKSTEDIIKPKVEEKTDLKSKVLDVNQGMEELRKSIERSLAELSAIEKNEKDAEEQFAKAQFKLEGIQELASKKAEEKKGMAKIGEVEVVQSQTASQAPKSEEISKPQETKQVETKRNTEKSTEQQKIIETPQENKIEMSKTESKPIDIKLEEMPVHIPEIVAQIPTPPPLPTRKDNKGKGKKKGKGKQDTEHSTAATTSSSASTTIESSSNTAESKESQASKKQEKSAQKTEKTDSQEKGKQQSDVIDDNKNNATYAKTDSAPMDFEPIENFEDAMTSSLDDVNKTFEIIAEEASQIDPSLNPEINITAPVEDDDKGDTKNAKEEKVNPVSQPKNLLGHPDIPARLNKADYKKEKDKIPNLRHAKVKIKDAVPIEVTKQSKESQTESKRRFLKDKTVSESISSVTNDNEEYIYKYSFRRVFLPSACHVCKKDLKPLRTPCPFCNLVFYCGLKHKDEDYPQHQALCFAVSTIGHLKEQKHIYADAKNITGQEYRLLRMQMIVSCEKVLKRRLVPWEQEALLYPRLCADISCRKWRQNKLVDCEGCGQIAYCSDTTDHLPKSHQRWCKSYSLYHRLVVYQQTKGRLEPKLPTKVMTELYQIPEKLNEVLASMFEEKIDMTDIQYAALTQIATAPLTAAFCQQLFTSKMNGIYANGTLKKTSFTIHVVGAELQFEADALNKWEVFFLHLRPDVKNLRVVLIGPDLNPSKLPLDLLGKIKLCENCRQNNRRVVFDFQDNKTYNEYWSTDFSTPDLVCAFNPSIQRSSALNGKDTWPSTINCIVKLRVPFIITSYTMSELIRDLARVKTCAENNVGIISEPKYNAFASVRPDRNFISDDEMPLLFKNFCFTVICGSI